jgi:hypothetical protein
VLNAHIAVRRSRPDLFGHDPFGGIFGGSPFSGMLGTTKPIRVHGDPILLDVRPRPANATDNYWLPAQQMDLQSVWHPSQLQAHVGDPVTVDLRLQAEGLTAAQLPDVSGLLSLPDGLKAYPDQAKLNDATRGDSVVGTREQSIALVADQPGRFTVPSLKLHWWDTATDQQHEVTLPERTLVILPAAGAITANASGSAGAVARSATRNPSIHAPSTAAIDTTAPLPGAAAWQSQGPWMWVSVGLGWLWLATLGGWLLSRRRRSATSVQPSQSMGEQSTPASASRARSAFREACRKHDPQSARRNLLTWVEAVWSGSAPRGLNALAKLLDDPKLSRLLGELDRACYAGVRWHGDALAEALVELPVPNQSARGRPDELAPLYPS